MRHQHQLEGNRKAGEDRLPHRLAGAEGRSPISHQKRPQPVNVAHQYRPVQSQVGANRLHLLLGGVHPGNVVGHIAGQDVHQQEGEQRDREQHHYEAP